MRKNRRKENKGKTKREKKICFLLRWTRRPLLRQRKTRKKKKKRRKRTKE